MNETPLAQQQTERRILVLCVDRDNDLEAKAGIKTPVLGREANVDAAVSLALKDPEEPDANAMFEAVRLTDRLQSEKCPEEIFEVATISGSQRGGVSADRKLVAELNAIIDTFNANEVILVSDGYTDEAVLPLIESRVPVSSVRRIVIKHSESIEETAALFSKYFKLLWDDPKYSRVALGLPGLLIFILGVLAVLGGNYLYNFGIALIIIVGGFLLIKGFGVDKSAKGFYKWAREYEAPPIPTQIANYAAIAGILCVAVSVYLGVTNAASYAASLLQPPANLGGWLAVTPAIAGYFIRGVQDLMVVGLGIVLFGRSLRWYFERDLRILRNSALIVSVAWSRWILDATAGILINPTQPYDALIFRIVIGILIGIASVLIIVILHRSARDFFNKPKATIEEFNEA
jgi:putative membrane protein